MVTCKLCNRNPVKACCVCGHICVCRSHLLNRGSYAHTVYGLLLKHKLGFTTLLFFKTLLMILLSVVVLA